MPLPSPPSAVQVWPHRPIAFDFDSLRLRLTKQDLQARMIAEMNNHYAATGTPLEEPTVSDGVSVCEGKGRVSVRGLCWGAGGGGTSV